MPKNNILGACNASSMKNNVNVNQVQFGNKLQGLAPSSRNSNMNYGRSYGTNKNVVFFINQLGGIGRNKSMFNNNADANRNKKSYKYKN